MGGSESPKSGLPALSLVLGYIAVKELGEPKDRMRVLAQLGYGNAEMACICGLTMATVKRWRAETKSKRR